MRFKDWYKKNKTDFLMLMAIYITLECMFGVITYIIPRVLLKVDSKLFNFSTYVQLIFGVVTSGAVVAGLIHLGISIKKEMKANKSIEGSY